MQGTVKFYNESKGFGFITTANGEEVFVHITCLVDKIKQDDNVEFEITQGKKGPNAVNVKLV
ncbi:cold shock domain-containing protein [Pedobacter frigidisoli]|uniref:Cold shock domain-containing protein n=1 Tax=Pedobacter frigidisoli TaxID=2530455 RepID=A0A4R0P3C4_9SPHI|nr:cold shock domain-containing protein [Pedobacter frigidisoli]TCD08314.1 cold shock domain-containing protein [Pedobacter frigidisoli]